jgi:hypothetical protein
MNMMMMMVMMMVVVVLLLLLLMMMLMMMMIIMSCSFILGISLLLNFATSFENIRIYGTHWIMKVIFDMQ